TTPSLDALKAYNAARRAHAASGPAALPLFKQAIAIDPTFAIAHAYLGHTYGESGESALAAEQVTAAYRLRDRVSDVEKLFLTVSYALRATGNLESAQEAAAVWVRMYPRDMTPHAFLAGMILPVLGKYAESIEAGKRA